MAVRPKQPPRSSKRVPLKRPGSRGEGNTFSRRMQKPKRVIRIPWAGIGRTVSVCVILFFSLIIVAGVSIALLYGYRSLTTGAYFSLKTIEIQGNSRLSSREVLEITGLDTDVNTLALSIDEVGAALEACPWVREVSVKRVLPDTLVVGIKEKEPAFWVLSKGTLYYADAFGKLIAPVVPGKFASLPTLEVEPGAEDAAFSLPDLIKSLKESRLPLNMASVSWVRLSAARGVEVFVEDGRLKLTIGLEEWLANLERLGRTLVDLDRRNELPIIREIKAQGSNVWVERATRGAVDG